MKVSTGITLLILITFSFILCKSKESPHVTTEEMSEKAITFYNSIHHDFNPNKHIQQNFIDRFAELQIQLQRNRNGNFDKIILLSLMDSAWSKNINTLRNIEKIPEIDSVINYKAKIIVYLNKLNHLYEKEFRGFIYILANKQFNEIGSYNKHLMPELQKLKELGISLKNAQIEFKEKYNFTTLKNEE